MEVRDLLKGPGPELLADRLIHSELHFWNSCLWSTKDIQGGAELSGFRARAGGTAFSWTEIQTEAIVLLLSTPRSQPADVGTVMSESPSTWIIQVALPGGFPETPPLPTYGPTQAASSDLFHTNGLSWLLL